MEKSYFSNSNKPKDTDHCEEDGFWKCGKSPWEELPF